jgi:hypothetical protein
VEDDGKLAPLRIVIDAPRCLAQRVEALVVGRAIAFRRGQGG